MPGMDRSGGRRRRPGGVRPRASAADSDRPRRAAADRPLRRPTTTSARPRTRTHECAIERAGAPAGTDSRRGARRTGGDPTPGRRYMEGRGSTRPHGPGPRPPFPSPCFQAHESRGLGRLQRAEAAGNHEITRVILTSIRDDEPISPRASPFRRRTSIPADKEMGAAQGVRPPRRTAEAAGGQPASAADPRPRAARSDSDEERYRRGARYRPLLGQARPGGHHRHARAWSQAAGAAWSQPEHGPGGAGTRR